MIDSPDSIHAESSGGGGIFIHVDRSLAKQFMQALWLSAWISGIAVVGLIATLVFIYVTINKVEVLQYDLFDLRAKVGEAHENTPRIEQEEDEGP